MTTKVCGASQPDRIQHVAWQLWRVHGLARRRISAELDRLDLQAGTPRMLHFINDHPDTSQSALAKHMVVTDAAMTQTVRKLVSQGYIETTTNPEDQRRKRLRLTEQGVNMMKTCDALLKAVHEEIFSHLTEAELDQLSELLTTVERNVTEA